MITNETPQTHINTPRQVLFASMVGTTVEFSAVLTFLGLLLIRETKEDDLTVSPS
jgi:hypothetical protein